MPGVENERNQLHQGAIWPVMVAIGVSVLLVGLIVSPLEVPPLGGALALVAGFLWARDNRRPSHPAREPVAHHERREPGGAERFPRSRMLERMTLGLGGLIALAVGAPAAGLAILPGFLGQRSHDVDLGPVDAFPEGKFVVATFLSDPRLGEVSRRAAYIRNNGPLGKLPSFTIMSSRCTHVGCPTQPNGPLFMDQRSFARTSDGEVGLVPTQPAGFGCPCHGSQFDTEGNRTAGPAPRPLDRYQFSIRNGDLVLGQLYSVSHVDGAGAEARIHAYRLVQAGQPAIGIESDFYPLQPAQ
jgi:Rieske Fe-S protein